jgi:hypothetical protein
MDKSSLAFQELAKDLMKDAAPSTPPPAVEPQAEPVAPASSEPPAPITSNEPPAPQGEPTKKDIAIVIKEKYGYEDPEKFFEEYEKKPKEVEKIVEKEIEYPNERVKQLIEYVKKGGTEEEYYRTQFTNWDNVSKEDALKLVLKEEFPKANEKQIEALFKKKYSSSDELDDMENELLALKMETEASAFIEKKKLEQIKILDVGQKQPTADDLRKQREMEEFRAQWDKDSTDAVSKLSSLTFDLEYVDENGEKAIFKTPHNVDTKILQEIEEVVKNPQLLLKLYTNENGMVDAKKLAQGVYLQRNFDKVVSDIANRHATEVKEAFIKKNLINADFKKMQVANKDVKDDYQKLKEAYQKANGGGR